MSGITRDDWLTALRATEPACDPDALTGRELGALLGIKASATKERVRRLLANGTLLPSQKRITDAAGRPHLVVAYLLAKPPKKRK